MITSSQAYFGSTEPLGTPIELKEMKNPEAPEAEAVEEVKEEVLPQLPVTKVPVIEDIPP